MMKTLRILIAFLLVPVAASAQWTFQHVFPDTSGGVTTPINNSAHGIAIDTDGKVWVGPYYGSTIDGNTRNIVRIFNPDGTQASFSPIWSVSVGDTTLRFGPITGLSSDEDGNVFVSTDGYRIANATNDGGIWNTAVGGQDRAFVHMFRANGSHVKTFDVTVVRLAATPTAKARSHTPNRVGLTNTGHMLVSYVFGASPIGIYEIETGEFVGNVTTEKRGFSRSFEVSSDGNVAYSPNSGNGGMIDEWVSDSGVFGEYELRTDRSLGLGMQSGSVLRYPGDEILVATAAGIGNDPDAAAPWNSTRTYFLSVGSGLAVDSLRWEYGSATTFAIPRSMAVAPDGKTMYIGTFSTAVPAVQKWTRSTASSLDGDTRVSEFALSQNYPNPFNPSTRISFTIPQAGDVTLKVYDMLGREVATLVNGTMAAGTHYATFDASGMSSGIYLYELRSGNTRITNKMTLMK